MGATAADTKREIEEIRKDVSSAVSELERRVKRVASPGTYLEFARENPAAILGVGLGAASLASVAIVRSIMESRRQNRPDAFLVLAVRRQEQLVDRLDDLLPRNEGLELALVRHRILSGVGSSFRHLS